jgi:hypothetical protein
MIVSHSLGNEAHVDQDIADRCVSIWTVGAGTHENPEGSYFVLPYLTLPVKLERNDTKELWSSLDRDVG